jgi:hypothetical protein
VRPAKECKVLKGDCGLRGGLGLGRDIRLWAFVHDAEDGLEK